MICIVICIYRRRFTSTCWTSLRRGRCGSSQRSLRRSTRLSMFWYVRELLLEIHIIPQYIKENTPFSWRLKVQDRRRNTLSSVSHTNPHQINNAGCMVNQREMNSDGLEKNFATNTLGKTRCTVALCISF